MSDETTKRETLADLAEAIRKMARDMEENADWENDVIVVDHTLVEGFNNLADRIEAAHDREVQDALDTGGLLGTSHRAKTDGVALVPARIALNLCRAIGERDRQKQEAFVRELADWLSANGHDDLGGYALAQIGAIPVLVPM